MPLIPCVTDSGEYADVIVNDDGAPERVILQLGDDCKHCTCKTTTYCVYDVLPPGTPRTSYLFLSNGIGRVCVSLLGSRQSLQDSILLAERRQTHWTKTMLGLLGL